VTEGSPPTRLLDHAQPGDRCNKVMRRLKFRPPLRSLPMYSGRWPTKCPAFYFFFVGVGTAGRSCRAVKADCVTVGFGFSCFGFFCSRLLRFWPLAIEYLLNQSAPDPAALGRTKQYTPFRRGICFTLTVLDIAGQGLHPLRPMITFISPVTTKVCELAIDKRVRPDDQLGAALKSRRHARNSFGRVPRWSG
jgi:hypothetical protein